VNHLWHVVLLSPYVYAHVLVDEYQIPKKTMLEKYIKKALWYMDLSQKKYECKMSKMDGWMGRMF